MMGLLRHTLYQQWSLVLDIHSSCSLDVSCDFVLRCERLHGIIKTLEVSLFLNSYIVKAVLLCNFY